MASRIYLGLLHGPPIAEAAGQTQAVGRVALVFDFLLDHELERVVPHAPMIPRRSVHENPLQASIDSRPTYRLSGARSASAEAGS